MTGCISTSYVLLKHRKAYRQNALSKMNDEDYKNYRRTIIQWQDV